MTNRNQSRLLNCRGSDIERREDDDGGENENTRRSAFDVIGN